MSINEFSAGVKALLHMHTEAASEMNLQKMRVQLKKSLELVEDIADNMAMCEAFSASERKAFDEVAAAAYRINGELREKVKADAIMPPFPNEYNPEEVKGNG